MDPKMDPKWTQNGAQNRPKLTPNGPYIGDPYIGNPYIGNPYIGIPYIGNPYIGNPYIWGPGLPKSSRFAKKVILGGKSALFAQKIILGEKVASGAEKRKFCSQNGKKRKRGSKTPKKQQV